MEEKTDIYRDTPVRYLGYSNEVGEAFRSIVGTKWVIGSYAVAVCYVFADTTDKSINIYQNTPKSQNRTNKTAFAAADTLIWQMLASVAIPGFTINRICAGSNYLLKKVEKLPKNNRKWIVTAVGLSCIPFIIKPIDHFVDKVLDISFRKLEKYIK